MTLSSTPLSQSTTHAPDVAPSASHDAPHAVFAYDLDGTTYEYDQPTITGAEVMAAGGIPASEGIVQVLPDGTRETVAPDGVIHLVSGAQFKRRPRFKRG
jgi:Multiubiquitin